MTFIVKSFVKSDSSSGGKFLNHRKVSEGFLVFHACDSQQNLGTRGILQNTERINANAAPPSLLSVKQLHCKREDLDDMEMRGEYSNI